jgi:hypothetical protein
MLRVLRAACTLNTLCAVGTLNTRLSYPDAANVLQAH